ncbi:hypothetical protein NW811_11860 [Synechococcus sp. R60.4]|jgi:hypothetical protein|uniref:hypothetical protein n=1 Tax=Synechococcus sp. R60.4 TaxID=2964520 RepID=UPI0039C1F784
MDWATVIAVILWLGIFGQVIGQLQATMLAGLIVAELTGNVYAVALVPVAMLLVKYSSVLRITR